MYLAPANPYQSQAVTTAGPAQLVLMLYDRALTGIERSRQADGPGRLETINHELVRAQDILMELRVTLDHERGGVIADSLSALYEFCVDRLIEANLAKDLAILDDVEPILRELRDAWEQACCGARAPVGAAAG